MRFKQHAVFICLETGLKCGVFLNNSPLSLKDSGRQRWNGNTLSASLALAAPRGQSKCEIHGRTPAKLRDKGPGRTAVPVSRSQRVQWAENPQPALGKLPGESFFLQPAEEITHIRHMLCTQTGSVGLINTFTTQKGQEGFASHASTDLRPPGSLLPQ